MKKSLYFMIFITIVLGFILQQNSVNNELTIEDKIYAKLFLKDIKKTTSKKTFSAEIAFIKQVQFQVIDIAKKGIVINDNKGIPFGTTREPKDVYINSTNLCFDISRTIEKILMFNGFNTRHISLYSTQKTKSKIKSLVTPGVNSHAFLEVLTSKGWLVVDSTANWISVNEEGIPVPLKDIQLNIIKQKKINWRYSNINEIFTLPFTFVYGLYSRHGKFYPPYNSIPDIEYNEFLYNVIDF